MLRQLFYLGLLVFPASADVSLRQLVSENRLAEALPPCRQLEANPGTDSEKQTLCAWVFLRAGKVESGSKLVALLNKSAKSPMTRLLTAYLSMQKGSLDSAREILNDLTREYKIGPLGVQVQETAAELYEMQGQKDTAAFLYKQVLVEDPNSGRSHWGVARFFLAKGDVPKAKEHLERVVKLWPKHVGSRYNMAVIALGENRFPDAARWLVESYRLDKGDPGILEQMGVLFEKRGKTKEAIKFWQRAYAISNESAIAKEKLQQYAPEAIARLAQKKDYDGAIAQLESTPNNKISKKEIRKAVLLRNAGQLDKSTVALNSYLKSNPKDPVGWRELGINQLNAKSLKLAMNSFLRALNYEPQNGTNFAWIGFTLEGMGKYTEAKEAWKKAIDLLSDPSEIAKAQKRLAAVEAQLSERRKVAREREESGDDDRDIEKEIQSMDIFEGVDGIPKY